MLFAQPQLDQPGYGAFIFFVTTIYLAQNFPSAVQKSSWPLRKMLHTQRLDAVNGLNLSDALNCL